MEEQVGNGISYATVTEQRLLQLKGVAGHFGGLVDLFAIRPANKNSASKTGGENQQDTQNKKAEKSYNCPIKNVCPELEIPNLIGVRVLNLQDMSMNQSEHQVLRKQHKPVQSAVLAGNSKLVELVEQARRYNTSVQIPITDSLSPLATTVGNYTYLPGGHWKPTSCLPRWKVAIIFPYRNRSYHLPIVLRYLTPMLQRQLLEFAFYTVNQENKLAFNRAMLMNVGFMEALNFSKWDCFIFHDVDHVPLSDFNYYGCSGMPRHFLSGSDRWKYKLPYPNFFGAVTGFTTTNIRKINGFPNMYWGWGGEDDEIWKRVKEVGLPVSRTNGRIGHYDVIKHHHNSAPEFQERMKLLKSFKHRFRLDGLSNLQYVRPRFELHALYTNISVDIKKLKVVMPKLPSESESIRDSKLRKRLTIYERRAAAAKAALANGHVKTKSVSEVKKGQSLSEEEEVEVGEERRPPVVNGEAAEQKRVPPLVGFLH